jgi:AAHS family 4-hydroxybenzoate transporter-like MFS transporter
MVTTTTSRAVDESRLGLSQLGVFILCSLALVADGLVVQSIGYTAPTLFGEWGIPNAAGRVASFTLTGLLIGSLLFSMLADRIGRRPVLILATLHFSIFTLWTGWSGSLNELLLVRFAGGIGMGGIMPNALALCGEYSPQRLRVAVMMIVGNSFTAGAMIGGFIAAALIPAYGWRAVFYTGGGAGLAIAVVMIFLLPESQQFLSVRRKRSGPAAHAEFTRGEPKPGVPIIRLFYEGRALSTLLIWAVNFTNLINLYFLSTWLTTVARDAGYSESTATLVGTTLQVGGMVGALTLGWFIRSLGFVPVLAACFALASLNIAAIGQSSSVLWLLFTVVGLAGFFVIGSQAGLNALSGSYYPTHLRSTGIGAGLGVGRVGSIIGPYIGELLRARWSAHDLFLVFALPALLSVFMMVALRWTMRQPAGEG